MLFWNIMISCFACNIGSEQCKGFLKTEGLVALEWSGLFLCVCSLWGKGGGFWSQLWQK